MLKGEIVIRAILCFIPDEETFWSWNPLRILKWIAFSFDDCLLTLMTALSKLHTAARSKQMWMNLQDKFWTDFV